MTRHLPPGVILLAAAVAWPSVAGAAPPAGEAKAGAAVSQAQALFDQGVADMEAGRFEKACPAIEASQRMEPMPGTLFTLAECEAQRGRYATAMRYYAEYLTLFRGLSVPKKYQQGDRGKTSERQIAKLDALAPRLTLVVPAGGGPDVTVKRDGDVVAELSLGTAFAVDPGEHVVTTQVPGGPEVEHRITLAAGEARRLELSVRRAPSAAPKAARPPSAALLAAPPPADVRPWRIGTWSAGAVAVAGLAVGAVTGILAIQERNRVSDNCHPDGGCNAVGLAATDRVRALGTASTIGFVTGGVGLAVGITLLVATPSTPTSSQSVGRAPANSALWSPFGILVTGNF